MSANQEQNYKQSIDIELLKRHFEEIPPIKSQTIKIKILNKILNKIQSFVTEVEIDNLSVRVHRTRFMTAVASFTTDYEAWHCECSPILFDIVQHGDIDLIRQAISMYM